MQISVGARSAHSFCRGLHDLTGILLDFLRTGYYDRSDGDMHGRITNGYWWSFVASSDMNGHYLATYPTGVVPQDDNYRGYGFAVRCVVREG